MIRNGLTEKDQIELYIDNWETIVNETLFALSSSEMRYHLKQGLPKRPFYFLRVRKTFCSYIKHFKDFMNILVNMLLEEIWFKMLYHQITISIQSYLLFFYPLGWVETWCNTIYNLHVSTHASAFLKCMKTSIIVCMS